MHENAIMFRLLLLTVPGSITLAAAVWAARERYDPDNQELWGTLMLACVAVMVPTLIAFEVGQRLAPWLATGWWAA